MSKTVAVSEDMAPAVVGEVVSVVLKKKMPRAVSEVVREAVSGGVLKVGVGGVPAPVSDVAARVSSVVSEMMTRAVSNGVPSMPPMPPEMTSGSPLCGKGPEDRADHQADQGNSHQPSMISSQIHRRPFLSSAGSNTIARNSPGEDRHEHGPPSRRGMGFFTRRRLKLPLRRFRGIRIVTALRTTSQEKWR